MQRYALVLLAMACGDEGDDSGTLPPADWAEVRDDILVPSCGTASCHGPPGAGGLGFDGGSEDTVLVGVAATGDPSRTLVRPGDPDGSYLVQKLEGAAGIAGDPMPPPQGGLPEEKIARIRSWIETL